MSPSEAIPPAITEGGVVVREVIPELGPGLIGLDASVSSCYLEISGHI